jgi:hypothetical membrane protein
MRDHRLLFGVAAAALLAFAMLALPAMVPGYDPVRQTVSEIGEAGSPTRIPFAAALCAIALCLLVFALGLLREAGDAGRGRIGAWLVAFMAIPVAGVGVFAFPHPLHNVFGMLELIGYQAPLAFALAWGKDPARKHASLFSWFAFLLVWISIALNLASIGRGEIWTHIEPIYGLVQRSLFTLWFGWAAILAVMLWRKQRSAAAVL